MATGEFDAGARRQALTLPDGATVLEYVEQPAPGEPGALLGRALDAPLRLPPPPDLGATEFGDVVQVNRHAVESDLLIYVGNVAVNIWGGYSGTGSVVGLAGVRGFAGHHGRHGIGHPDSCHGDPHAMLYQRRKRAVAAVIDRARPRPVLYVDRWPWRRRRLRRNLRPHPRRRLARGRPPFRAARTTRRRRHRRLGAGVPLRPRAQPPHRAGRRGPSSGTLGWPAAPPARRRRHRP